MRSVCWRFAAAAQRRRRGTPAALPGGGALGADRAVGGGRPDLRQAAEGGAAVVGRGDGAPRPPALGVDGPRTAARHCNLEPQSGPFRYIRHRSAIWQAFAEILQKTAWSSVRQQ